MNKYNSFFLEYKDTYNSFFKKEYERFYKKTSIENVNDYEIKNKVILNNELRYYLKYFGNTRYFNHLFSFSSMTYAYSMANKYSIFSKIVEYQKENESSLKTLNIGVKDIQFLNFIEYNWVWTFVLKTHEDSFIYHWDGDEIEMGYKQTLVTYCRTILFAKLRTITDDNSISLSEQYDIRKNFSWSNFYLDRIEKKIPKPLMVLRIEFMNLMQDTEIQKDRIFGVEEYEVAFINFLEKNYHCH